jgi:hypothetical protein
LFLLPIDQGIGQFVKSLAQLADGKLGVVSEESRLNQALRLLQAAEVRQGFGIHETSLRKFASACNYYVLPACPAQAEVSLSRTTAF